MFKSSGRFIIVLLDQSVTITLYICVLFINNPICGNFHMFHCHVLCYIYLYIYIYVCVVCIVVKTAKFCESKVLNIICLELSMQFNNVMK